MTKRAIIARTILLLRLITLTISARKPQFLLLTYDVFCRRCVYLLTVMHYLGIPLEMTEQGWIGSLRVAVVYIAGVLLGSMATSVIAPKYFLCGASAGVYALVAAHIGT